MGTSSGTVWYINWPEKSNVKLVSGHADQVRPDSYPHKLYHIIVCSFRYLECHSLLAVHNLLRVVLMGFWLCGVWKLWNSLCYFRHQGRSDILVEARVTYIFVCIGRG